ncbi:MAG: hypothetical protein KDK97_21050 [Verrucomicrobiales bacterium]|nr:hypothetical protein [Verrucomicrobiales bacterium]MCP5558772.1 hypothetical protein [Verrucomicrobiaceae bacterium]
MLDDIAAQQVKIDEADRAVDEAKKRFAASVAKIDKDAQQRLIDHIVDRRVPLYEDAMRGWGIDQQRIDGVIAAVREREKRVAELRREIAVTRDVKAYQSGSAKCQAEALDKVQALLGSDLMEKFRNLESRMSAPQEE